MPSLLGVTGALSREQAHEHVAAMSSAVASDGAQNQDRLTLAGFGCAAFQHCRELSLAGALIEKDQAFSALVVVACLDNRQDLVSELGLSTDKAIKTTDPELAILAWHQWGSACHKHLLGDWIIVHWDERQQQLTLLRDHCGNSVLYFAVNKGKFAFSTSGLALLELPWVSKRFNELSLACFLTNLEPVGFQTMYADLSRVPPGWMIILRESGRQFQRYWFPEDTPLWLGQSESTYSEALRNGIRDSVARMLRGARSPALQMSGGLDSGAVAWAAGQSKSPDQQIPGLCAVPLHDTQDAWPNLAITNELPLAQDIGQMTGIGPVIAVPADGVSVLDGIRWAIASRLEPSIGAGNMYWISALLQQARVHGHDLVLTGQLGNATISWYGRPWTRTFLELWQHRSPAGAIQHKLLRPLLSRMGRDLVNRWRIGLNPWLDSTLIHPEFAQRVHLGEYISEEAYAFWYHTFQLDPLSDRMRVFAPGADRVAGRWAEMGNTLGMRVRDPTASKQLVELCISIPDREWSGPAGSQRWLARNALQDCLPPEITATLARGRQASDIVQRLLADREQTELVLDQCTAESPVAQYVNVERSQETWRALQNEPFTYKLQQRCLRELIPAVTLAIFLEARGE